MRTFQEYLKSNKWKTRAKKARKLFKRCMWCGNKNGLKVFHRHLESWGRENIITDLSVFCKACVQKFGLAAKKERVNADAPELPRTQVELRSRVKEIRKLKDKSKQNL